MVTKWHFLFSRYRVSTACLSGLFADLSAAYSPRRSEIIHLHTGNAIVVLVLVVLTFYLWSIVKNWNSSGLNRKEMAESQPPENPADPEKAKSILEFSAYDIDGNLVSLEKYQGYVAYIVNVASK